MNDTAQRLGMPNTHFSDPSGLPVPDDFATYSTPAELVRLGRHAMAHPVFREIVQTQTHHQPAGPANRDHVWATTNGLLREYPGSTGIKTGSTNAAGACLLFEATRGGQRLIGVVLNSSPHDSAAAKADAERILNWGFIRIGLEFAMLVILVGALVSVVVLYMRGRSGFQLSNPESGSLYITGVSPRPDDTGEQYVTITGNLTGPSAPGTVVYGRFAWDVNAWPSVGDLVPVVYPPGKPERWQISDPGARPGLGS